MTVDNKFYFPIVKQIESRVTRVTPGGSLRERLAAARQKPVVETPTVGIPEKPKPADPEPQYAIDERQPIIDVDGGHGVPGIGPVTVKMKSAILGATVDVHLWPDRAEVDGVGYSLPELKDLLSRKLNHDDLREVHRVKQEFEGTVVPSEEVEAFQFIARW